MNWVVTYAFLSQAMADLTETGASPAGTGVLEACFCGLYLVGSPAPSPTLLMSQVLEANYDGYARQEVVWFPTFVGFGANQALVGHNLFFAPLDDTVANTIGGVFLATALTGGQLLMAALLNPPLAITALDAAMVVKPVFLLSTTSVYGGPDVEF